MRPARDEPRLPWHPLQPARRHHHPSPGHLPFLKPHPFDYDNDSQPRICCLWRETPGGVAELNDQPAVDQPLLLQPPSLLLGNPTLLLEMKQRSVSKHLKVLEIY